MPPVRFHDTLNATIQSFLHNRLGGLQVLPPGSDKWLYVKVRNNMRAYKFVVS